MQKLINLETRGSEFLTPLEAKISINKFLQQLVISSEMPKIWILTHTPYIGITLVISNRKGPSKIKV
jgi:hypothetical protein